MDTIYGNQDGLNCLVESPDRDIESKFINSLCNLFCEVMEVDYIERRIVVSLLKTSIKNKLDSRYKDEGLLQQYGAYILDTASKSLIEELNLGNVKVNHSHATHAKFRDILEAIKEKIKEK